MGGEKKQNLEFFNINCSLYDLYGHPGIQVILY